jgi:hypothetical protein
LRARARSKSPTKKFLNLRKPSINNQKKITPTNAFTLEEEIRQLQLKSQKPKSPVQQSENNHNNSSVKNMEPITFKMRTSTFESRLANIGRLDSNKRLELPLTPNRSSTPDEKFNK